MSEVGTYEVIDGIGLITIDNPPVNALGIKARLALDEGFRKFSDDKAVRAIVLMCGGRTFFAGADISEFGKPVQKPDLRQVLNLIEGVKKPVIAAIHGTALGGGYELSLVCHYRIAVPSAQLGLPEVKLGLLPAGGGTQRLPRIVGVPVALDIMTGGQPVRAGKALELGMIDALAREDNLRADAISFAQEIVRENKPLVRVRDRQDKVEPYRGKDEFFEDYLARNAKAFRCLQAPVNIVRAVQAAADLPFEEGSKRELELFLELMSGTQSGALRNYFFAERQTSKIPDVPPTTRTIPVKRVGVIGAGTMGGGITMNFLNAGIPVTLVETSQEALDRGLGVIRRNYEATAAKGRMSQAQVETRMGLIAPGLDLNALADVDLIIEAVFEEMSLKKAVFSKLDGIARQGAILASNTSFLNLDDIASATSRPESVVGLHFFSPANVMRLLEVVRGAKTSDEVVATAMELGKTIGKIPVLAGVCPGFIANRAMAQRMAQANDLVLRGPSPAEIDRALYNYGFAMGPFQMVDLVGLDVMGRGSSDRTLNGDLVAKGRLGQKKNGGYYDYDDKRKASPSAVAAEVIADYAKFKGIESGASLSQEDIVGRLLYPVVNEGAKLLEEGIALRASDIDVACILGYNWPAFTGGPMYWADTVGLQKVVDSLRAMNIEPARLLVEKAAQGEKLAA
jgi:3-hydroxyacyl-CoA dehydrogenase